MVIRSNSGKNKGKKLGANLTFRSLFRANFVVLSQIKVLIRRNCELSEESTVISEINLGIYKPIPFHCMIRLFIDYLFEK